MYLLGYLLIIMSSLVTAKCTQSARSSPNPDADTAAAAAAAPEWTHLHDTVISTLVAGMLPLMGSKSRTVAVASTLSITSPSMGAGDPGRLPLNLKSRGRRAGAQRTRERERIRSNQTS